MADRQTDLATFATAVAHMQWDRLLNTYGQEMRRSASSDYVNHGARATVARDEIARRVMALDYAERKKLDKATPG